jgi:hypothetical protein
MSTPHCPLLKKACIEHRCRWYIQLLGSDPQTGEQLNKWGCAIEFLPVLLIENAKEVRQTAAAVESTRNENARNTAAIASALLSMPKDVTPALEGGGLG